MTVRDILIIGGTGVFGQRLVRHLAAQDGVALHVSSRRAAKAAEFIKTVVDRQAALHPVGLDCQVNLADRLAEIRPFIVVDCSGPFQGASYDTARTVLQAGAHFIDLADARDYLAGFVGALDETARSHKVSALSGASSTPTLSTCVATAVTAGWQRIDSIDMCITPGGKSEVGQSVIAAIMSYAGKDVPIWSSGRLTQVTGWRHGKRVDIPGLGRRRVAAVETYDAAFLGPRLNVQSRVSFSAGLESRIEQWGIEAIAFLRKRGLMGSPAPLIPLLLKARKVTRIPTSASGGMLVDVCGLDAQGMQTQSKWTLVAHEDHGPYIPILPAAAAIRKLLAGAVTPGASFAHAAVDLADILQEMQPYNIATQTQSTQTEIGIFEQSLGADAFAALPKELTTFHAANGPLVWSGQADVVRGQGVLSKIVGAVFGFPKQGTAAPVTVTLDRNGASDGTATEVWTRHFDGRPMVSVLRHVASGVVSECFAPFAFDLKLRADEVGVQMPVNRWRIGKIPLPHSLAPRSEAREYVDEAGRFCFDVKLSAPIVGMLAHYRGWLEPGYDRNENGNAP